MGTTLTGLTPATTYDALLKTTDNQPLTTSLKVITDGLGNNSAFSLSTLGASVTGTLAVSSTLTASNLSGTNTGDETQATIKSKLGAATTSVDGYLTSTDWTTFNNKVATTRSISTTAPLAGGGDLSANRTLSIAQATTSTDGYLSSTDWTTFNGKESVLTFSAPLSRATNTISIPAATTSVSGHLTSTDWTTFNNKVGGSGTTNYVPKFSGASTIGNSQIFDNGSGVGINTTTLGFNRFRVNGQSEINGNLQVIADLGVGGNINAAGSVYGAILYGSNITGDDFRFNVDSSGVVIRGNFSITETNLSPSLGYTASTGALSMSGALSGVTSISMGGALTGATNITASGTLNVGSTTTATKRLELTADNNSGENNTLRFVDTDTTSAVNQVIGKIEFFSSDATAPGGSVKAYISAHSLDTSPDAYLDFATDQVTGTPIVRQRIQADGKVLFGTTTQIPQNANLVQVNGGLDYNIIQRGSSSTAITLGLNDKGSFYEFSASASVAVTIPTNASVAFPIGTQIWFVQGGAGVPTFSGDTGVTLRTRSSVRQPFARYSEVKLTKVAADEWYLTGDLKA
jgi:hypothetical protein